MADSKGSSTELSQPRRKRPFPFGLVMLGIGLVLGFWGGVSAIKSALTAPVWVQRIAGVYRPVPPQAAAPIPVVTAPTSSASQPTVAAPGGAPPGTVAQGSRPSAPGVDADAAGVPNNAAQGPAETKDLVGGWEATDNLGSDGAAGSAMTTSYLFRTDGSGEFNANGRKLYDFHWKPAGEDVAIVFEGQGPEAGQPWKVRLKWSLSADRSVLTLVPVNGKDPRAFVYSLGPGVYHKKA